MFPRNKRSLPLFLALLFISAALPVSAFDDEIPEVTDRVARISFIAGDVQIRRADTDEWEQAVLNLPIVEGDEVATSANGRFEIQFTPSKHIRVSENALVKIAVLRDEGIAVSASQGSVSVRLIDFDPELGYFEVDAPRTTVAVLRSGKYRIDAGQPDESEIGVAVGDEGEARIYSSTSGFTLRSGRSARVQIDGAFAGDWETTFAAAIGDDFDLWVRDREDLIANRLREAHYDRYYDREIYGAEELNDNGDWVYTREYGYVWRPFRTSISSYSDWSPYRYGHWRWVAPFGWTWINDEPWGWATYHYGRWIWHNGYWHWSPYGYYRHSRSWWRPALVVITIYSNNVCWYPLPYHYGYYNYNRHYNSRNPRSRRDDKGPGRTIVNSPNTPIPTPTPQTPGPVITNEQRTARKLTPPLQTVPPTGVVTVPASEFGRGKADLRRPPLSTARAVLSKVPNEGETPPILPIYREIESKISREIRTEKPAAAKVGTRGLTGASTRTPDEPLDRQLRTTRMLGNRPPLQNDPLPQPTGPTTTRSTEPRKTGAVERTVRSSEPKQPVVETPGADPPVRTTTRSSEPKSYTPERSTPRPIVTMPQQQPRREEQPRNDPSPRETPRYEPPPRSEPTRRPDPSESKPPPRSDPPKQRDPAPKSEPSKPSQTERRTKDG